MAHLSERAYATLSSGEQARVMIARILAQDSPVALLDEPTAALDLANAERAIATLTKPGGTDTTVICVLHDLNVASYFCDHLMLLDGGRLVASGSPKDVLVTELLSQVYRHELKVVDHPFRGCPLVLTV